MKKYFFIILILGFLFVPTFFTKVAQAEITSVSCVANQSSPIIGDSVTWTATILGGTGSYTVGWGGDEGLSGSDVVSNAVTYSTPGTKNAHIDSVTSSSGEVFLSSTECSPLTVSAPAPLSVSCTASPSTVNTGDSVNWTATVSGGLTPYTYSWNGDDSLSGSNQTVAKSYSSVGVKAASTTVASSDGQVVVQDCSNSVTVNSAPVISTGGGSSSGGSHHTDSSATTTATTTIPTSGTGTTTASSTLSSDDWITVLGMLSKYGNNGETLPAPAQIPANLPTDEGVNSVSSTSVGSTSTSGILEGQTAGLFSLFNSNGQFSWLRLLGLILIILVLGGLYWFFFIWKRDKDEEEKKNSQQK